MAVPTRIIFILVLWIGVSSYDVVAQSEEKDKADAVQTAHQVSRYLQRTQDIRPLLRKFAVKNFMAGIVEDALFNLFVALEKDLPTKLDPKIRDEYYIASSNWLYLLMVYDGANNKGIKNAYGGSKLVFPPGVESLMRGKPILSSFLDGGDGYPPKPKTIDDVRKAIRSIEEVNFIYRQHVKGFKRKPYKQYIFLTKKSLDGEAEFFKPDVWKCEKEWNCAGLPNGSRLIYMSVPGFSYGVACGRVQGRMKIVHIFQFPGD